MTILKLSNAGTSPRDRELIKALAEPNLAVVPPGHAEAVGIHEESN